jgi:hypothetical protein
MRPGLAGDRAGAVGAGGLGQRPGAFNQYVERRQRPPDGAHARPGLRHRRAAPLPAWLVVMALLLAAPAGRPGRCSTRWRLHFLPGRVRLRRGLHRVAEAAQLAQHRGRRTARGQLRGAGGRRGVDPGLGPCRCCWRWCCSCGRRRTSGAWPSPTRPTTRPPACRCCRSWSARTRRGASCTTKHGGAGGGLAAAGLLRRRAGLPGGRGIGGGHFLHKSWACCWREPSRKTAMGAFFASLVQLSLVLVAATASMACFDDRPRRTPWHIGGALLALWRWPPRREGIAPAKHSTMRSAHARQPGRDRPPDRRASAARSPGAPVRLADYRGKPLLVSFIYTGCFQVCPTTTQSLPRRSTSSTAGFGADQFNVVSIGFNQPFDSPLAMRAFAAQMRIDCRTGSS